jgi:hypothetical protein
MRAKREDSCPATDKQQRHGQNRTVRTAGIRLGMRTNKAGL